MSPLPITGMGASAALTDAFNLTGKLPLKLDETVVPVVMVADVGSDVYGPRAAAYVSVAAGGALNRSEVEISLPQVGSAQGASAIVDAMVVMDAIAGHQYSVGASPGLPAPNVVAQKGWLDVGRAGAPSVLVAGKNNAVSTPGLNDILSFYTRQHESLFVPLGWILQANPNTGLQQGLMVRNDALDTVVKVAFYWRERVPR